MNIIIICNIKDKIELKGSCISSIEFPIEGALNNKYIEKRESSTAIYIMELPLVSKNSMTAFMKGKFSYLVEKTNTFRINNEIKRVIKANEAHTLLSKRKGYGYSPVCYNNSRSNYYSNVIVLFSNNINKYISENELCEINRRYSVFSIEAENERVFKELIPVIIKMIIRKRPRPESIAILAKENNYDVKYWAVEMSKYFKEVVLFAEQTEELEMWREEFCDLSGAAIVLASDSRIVRKCNVILDLCGGVATTDIVRKAQATTTIINYGDSYTKSIRGQVISSETIHITPPKAFIREISQKNICQLDLTELSIVLLQSIYKDRIIDGIVDGSFELTVS